MSDLVHVPEFVSFREAAKHYFLHFWHIKDMGPLTLDQAQEVINLLNDNAELRTERNAMAEYLSGMACPYKCKSLVTGGFFCPHHAKLRELGITENKDCHADAWGWERGEDQQ